MDFTKSFLKSKNPCADGFRWYLRHHGEGSDYQQVLDGLVDAGRVADACWLLDKVGPSHTVLRRDRLACQALVFAGSIEVRGSIEVDALLRVGGSIRCGGSLRAGGDVVAGEDLRVAGGVRCAGALRCQGTLLAGWHADVGGSLQAGELKVDGDVRCAGPMAVVGAALVKGDLRVGGDCSVESLGVRGRVDTTGALASGQGLICTAGADCGGHIDAGWGIRSGGDVVAKGAIRAGESIAAEGEIRCGPGYGVFAGLCVQRDAWPSSARVTARTPPAGLMSGFWTGRAGEAMEAPDAH